MAKSRIKYITNYKGKEKLWIVFQNGKPYSKHYTFYNAQTGVSRHLRNDVKKERKLSKYNPWWEPINNNYEIKHISEID